MRKKIGKIVIAWLLVICMLAPMLPDVINANAADITDENNYDAMSMDAIFGLDKSLTWVFAGDSISQNDRWTQGMNGYAEWFEQYLYDIGRNDDSVILSAWSGASIDEIQPTGGISDDGTGLENMITKYNPDVVVIQMGMNDRDMTTEDFTTYYKAMLDGIYTEGESNGKIPKVVVCTPTAIPSENVYDDMYLETIDLETVADVQDSTLRISNAIKDVVAAYNTDITLCDLRSAFLEEALVLGDDYHSTFFRDSSDGKLHPNAAGQYLMFKTLCEALKRDMTSPIFQLDYDDINSGTLYVDGTSDVSYENNNYTDSNEIDDATEMNKEALGIKMLASVDFNDDNGVLDSSKNVDLTDKEIMDDELNVEEAQSMGKEYSVVFRAKFNSDTSGCAAWQSVFCMNANSSATWNAKTSSSLSVLFPAKNPGIYYSMKNKGVNQVNPEVPNSISSKTAADFGAGEWHTYAIVQSETNLKIYIDGVAMPVQNNGADYTLPIDIATLLADATAETFEAYLGDQGASEKTHYRVDGSFDYWQLYNGALTADEVEELSSVDDTEQMNNDMQTLDDDTLTRLADVDFSSTTGALTSSNKVSLTDSSQVTDVLTVDEAKGMTNEYSVVFRAKFATSGFERFAQAIFSMNANKGYTWNYKMDTTSQPASIAALLPGSGAMYYEVRYNATTVSNAGVTPSNFKSVADIGGGEWHTYALVQTAENLILYVDGEATVVQSGGKDYKLIGDIGTAFAASTANTFEAYIGSLGAKDDHYRVSGNFDYWQLYNSALTADNVATLTDAAEMNCTMPTLSTAITQNVLASVQFAEDNCILGGTENPYVDLTDASQVDDTLDLEEVQSMGKEYTVVFRAKLADPSAGNQSVFFVGSGVSGDTIWNSENLILNIPGSKTGGWYHLKNSEGTTVSSWGNFLNYAEVNGTISEYKTKYTLVDENWHTFVYVQSKSGLTLYIDGQAHVIKGKSSGTDAYLNDTIGNAFANTEDYVAYIGKLEGETTDYSLDGKFDYWTLYDGAFTPTQVQAITEVVESDTKTTEWSSTLTKNNVWVVAGAEQMSGYEGPVANRSLFRLLDNTMRYDPHRSTYHTDIRMVNASAPDFTVEGIAEQQSAIIQNYSPNVYMLLPEVSEVYDIATYSADEHEAKVTAYADTIKSIVSANKTAGVTTILWTPLASENNTINSYLADYANAVRDIVKANSDVLFFDAYRFMNDNMDNEVLKRNWFEDGSYISPLCALDLTYAFYTAMGETSILTTELTDHNLRVSSDARVFKSNYVNDNIAATAEVNDDKTVAIDLTNIFAVYPSNELTDIKITWAKEAGAGNANVKELTATADGNVYTVAAPCDNPVFVIYGTYNGMTYRFKDLKVAVTGVTVEEETAKPTSAELISLEVVGAPTITLESGKTEYDVQLYEYQNHVQVLATAQEGMTITVDGKEVVSGEYSQLIDATNAPAADSGKAPLAITVNVSGSAGETTYTLNLTREAYPDIIITEVMQDGYNGYTTSGADNYELIEIYNASGKDLNLAEYSIGFKQDLPESNQSINQGEWPYYFTGNNQAFAGRATYTGINEITKFSTYDENGSETKEDEIIFKANSTMVIWIKFAPAGWSESDAETYMDKLTYTTLIDALKAHQESGETKTVPAETQLVVAEVPKGAETAPLGKDEVYREVTRAEDIADNFYMDNNPAKRNWLFILDDNATQAENGSITEEGNNIISAAKFARIGNTDKLSSVLAYNIERGMSLVKDEATWDTSSIGTPHTSDEQGYSNATTFGAIEYWQKPVNTKDTEEPVVLSTIDFEDKAEATVNFIVSDDTDIRYVEIYAKKTSDENWTEVIKKDIVLDECIANTGVAEDNTSYAFSFETGFAKEETDAVQYYGVLVDGSGNRIEVGSAEEPIDSCKYEVVKYTATEVKAYIDGGTYPMDVEDYLFGGWYKTEDHENITNAITSSDDVPEGGAYALYVPKHVLGVKAQISDYLTDNDLSDDGTGAIRFVTTVDSLNYSRVGFYFRFGDSTTENERANSSVYTNLFYISKDGIDKTNVLKEYSPETSFCASSSYFKTHTFGNIKQSQYDLEIHATPFWETLDGTIVRGETVTKSINDARGSEWVYVSQDTGSDETGDGTEEKPYATLEHAFEQVKDKGVICIEGTYAVSTMQMPASEKFVTITGDTLDFTAQTQIYMNSPIRFDGVTMIFNDNDWIWANGYELTIAENVTVEGVLEYIFGGSNGGTIGSTDLTVLAGNYKMIFGGGYKANVTGDTNLHVGGNVNAELEDTFERFIYGGGFDNGSVGGNTNVLIDGNVNANKTFSTEKAFLYGGGRINCTVSGSTNVTVKGNAIFNYIYGGGHGSTVAGGTNVNVSGNVNKDYGGSGTANIVGGGYPLSSNSATVQGGTNITVGTDKPSDDMAKFCWIFGGARDSSVEGQINVTIKENTYVNNLWGGGFFGTNSDTSVTVEGGTVNILLGGSFQSDMTGNAEVLITGGTVGEVYGGNDTSNVTGNTEVSVLGGKITKAVYGGCKNPDGKLATSPYSVTGYTSVKLGPDADLALSTGDKAVYAVSRSSANADNEKGVFIINDYRNNANKFTAGTNAQSTVSLITSHHYFVNVSSGGDVSSQGSVLAITPNEGFKAVVKDVDGDVLATYEAAANYQLPTYDGKEIVLYVEFTKITSEVIYLSEEGSDETGDGTESNPYATLNYAIEQADNGDTISVVASTDNPYDVTSDSWEAHGKAVTITGGMMEFSTLSTLNIQDAVTFDNITLGFKNDAKVYANGYALTMGENVTFNNGAYINIYGAGNGTTVMDTNVTLLAGDYHKIYGAGTGGTVLGDTRLHIAGTVNKTREISKDNAAVVYGAGEGEDSVVKGNTNVCLGGDANSSISTHHSGAVVYGASDYGTVEGDTNVTIEGNVNVNRVYGGSYWGYTGGSTHVTVSGNVNSGISFTGDYDDDKFVGAHLYGGGFVDKIDGNTYVNVFGNAKFNAIYGGLRGHANFDIKDTVIGGNTNVTVSGSVNTGLTYDAVGFAYVFGGAYMGTVTGTTSVTVTDNANFYGVFGGGSTAKSTCGDAAVTVNGNVNAGLTVDDTTHSKIATVYGGSFKGTAGNTDVTIGGSAHLNYVFGGGSDGTSVAGNTSVTFNGTNARAYSIYGGSRVGTNTSTSVEMTAGWVAQIFGGCEGASMTGNTDVRVLGGEITRRIYGGCYNNYKDYSTSIIPNYKWEADYNGTEPYSVTGYTSITIGPNVTISFSASDEDRGVFAGSRYKKSIDGETGIVIFEDGCHDTKNGVLGRDSDDYEGLVLGSPNKYNYLVKASAGGTVTSQGSTLLIKPDSADASVSADAGSLVDNGDGTYTLTLPKNDTTITITFN